MVKPQPFLKAESHDFATQPVHFQKADGACGEDFDLNPPRKSALAGLRYVIFVLQGEPPPSAGRKRSCRENLRDRVVMATPSFQQSVLQATNTCTWLAKPRQSPARVCAHGATNFAARYMISLQHCLQSPTLGRVAIGAIPLSIPIAPRGAGSYKNEARCTIASLVSNLPEGRRSRSRSV